MMTMSSAKALESLIWWHDAADHTRKQRDCRHKVVTPATPGEQRHHDDDDGEGQPLSERHECRLAYSAGEDLDGAIKYQSEEGTLKELPEAPYGSRAGRSDKVFLIRTRTPQWPGR